MLSSGLPELVDGAESIVRFMTQSSHFSRVHAVVKQAAFLPARYPVETSVSRIEAREQDILEAWARSGISHGKLYGVAHLTASEVREIGLEVVASEPPHRHAAIVSWPSHIHDSAAEKSQHKELALMLASKASLLLLDIV